MKDLLWMFAIVLTVVFLVTGYIKIFRYELASSRMAWTKEVPRPAVVLSGILEILGALGLVLPAFIPSYGWLVAYAAIGLAILLASASVFHLIRREYDELTVVLLVLLLTAFIGFGRLVLYPLN